MKKRLVAPLAALALLAPLCLAAQQWGQTALGLEGGFTYIKYPGTKFFDSELHLPGFSDGTALPTPPSLFLIVPVSGRLAIEPSVTVGLSSNLLFWGTHFQLGLRADYLITPTFFGALGGVLVRQAQGNGVTNTSGYNLGAQAGLGARFHLTDLIDGRVEAQAQFWGKTRTAVAQNLYSLMLGFSAPLDGKTATRTGGGDARHPQRGIRLGIAGGLSDEHITNGSDQLQLSVPGSGTQAPFVSPPAFFVTVPLSNRLTLEPGLELHRTHYNGFTYATGALATHLNLGLGGGWYGGTGLVEVAKKSTGKPMVGVTGLSVQGGYEFKLAGAWNGRLELSHIIMARQRARFDPPLSVTSLMFGATVPVN
ncbi:MAG TPA: hypothetical protein VJS20_07815 [Gemmatimonadales bacterium]|nr:hypothetical protein [Gemmatimonadales bacterium]